MSVGRCNNIYRPNFKARFFHSESLKQIADYAVEHGKFDKLNQSRKNISKTHMFTRLRVDIGENNNGSSFMTIARFVPKARVLIAKTMDDYFMEKVTMFEFTKDQNIWKEALEKLIKMGNCAPKNKIFKNVVID